MTEDNKKSYRDGWDKAQTVSGFLSSVVIAIVGIYITYSIQQAQIASSNAQAEAQLKLAQFKAQADKKLQEGRLTAALIEHLASDQPNRREIAILALRETTPTTIYDNVLMILAKNDPDGGVRQTAISQLGESSNPVVLGALASISREEHRGAIERNLAIQSLDRVTFASSVARKMTIIGSTSPGEAPLDKSAFASVIVKGLTGVADVDSDGAITATELASYVRIKAINESQTPWYTSSGVGTITLSGSGSKDVKALVVSGNEYQSDALPSLRFAERDAQILTEGLKSTGAEVTLLLNPTSKQFLLRLDSLIGTLHEDEVLILYYGGHGFVGKEGGSVWLLNDAEVIDGVPVHSVSVKKVMKMLENAKSNVLLLVDTFTGSEMVVTR